MAKTAKKTKRTAAAAADPFASAKSKAGQQDAAAQKPEHVLDLAALPAHLCERLRGELTKHLADAEERAAEAARLTDDELAKLVHTAVADWREAAAAAKSAGDARTSAHHRLMPVALWLLAAEWAAQEEFPAPLKLRNPAGQRVTLVVQDKSRGAAIGDKMYAELKQLVNTRSLNALLDVEDVYSISPEILAQPLLGGKRGETVCSELQRAIAGSRLSPEQRENLLTVSTQRRTKDSLLPELLRLAGHDPKKLAALLEALQGRIVPFFQA